MRILRLAAVCAMLQLAAWAQQTVQPVLEISGEYSAPANFPGAGVETTEAHLFISDQHA
jgi:hypothetical protein